MPFECGTTVGATGSGTMNALGDALRVLEQVDSDLHRTRFRDQSRALGRELRGNGQVYPARLAAALAQIAATPEGRARPLERKDIALMRDGYRALARAVSAPEADHPAPTMKKLTVRIAERLGERG